MNGWDALKTGRRVRKNYNRAWLSFVRAEFDKPNVTVNYGREEFDADDWEVEPRPVEVTREKLAEVWNEHVMLVTPGKAPSSGAFNSFCRALGLEP